jgi:LmbE family N-acetylglucosaminyl deacetylase
MRELILRSRRAAPLRILCLGAHSDDIEIGCGGLILELLAAQPATVVHWVVFSGDAARAREARASARSFLRGARRPAVATHRFRDGFFPYEGNRIKTVFEKLKQALPALDLVLTHYRDDLHQDHRVISDLTWNTFRDHMVLEYEVPKYDGDLGTPNCYVPIARATSDRKATMLMEAFGSQRDRHWFSPETFLALMRLRGIECRAPEGYAEAFYARKLSLSMAI